VANSDDFGYDLTAIALYKPQRPPSESAPKGTPAILAIKGAATGYLDEIVATFAFAEAKTRSNRDEGLFSKVLGGTIMTVGDAGALDFGGGRTATLNR
jgi:hypothetical protein